MAHTTGGGVEGGQSLVGRHLGRSDRVRRPSGLKEVRFPSPVPVGSRWL